MPKSKSRMIIAIAVMMTLSSCGENDASSSQGISSDANERLSHFINEAKKGFELIGNKKQQCKDLSGNDLFTNLYSYDFTFENDEHGTRTSQVFSYKYKGETQTSSIDVVRSPDGYVAQEYIDYRNELSYYKVPDDDGYYSFYDEYFSNPFNIVSSDDFSFLSGDDGFSYSLSKEKLDSFDYFLTGNSESLLSLSLTIKDDGSAIIESHSVGFSGRTLDSDNNYIRCTWDYHSSFEIDDLGTAHIDGATSSENKENAELASLLSAVSDNFTLTCSILSPTTGEEVGTKKISYFDGESYYIQADSSDTSMANDYLYHKDPFNDDDESLYEYRYDETSKLWHKSDSSSSSSYNISPQGKEMFVPNISKMSKDIFADTTDDDGYYFVNNADAVPFAGMGFFSEAETLPYFTLGYGYTAKIKKEGESIVALVDFLYPYDSSTVLSVRYKAVYSNIGSTTIPEVDL